MYFISENAIYMFCLAVYVVIGPVVQSCFAHFNSVPYVYAIVYRLVDYSSHF